MASLDVSAGEESRKITSVERALMVMDAFRSGAANLSLSQLAKATGLNKSTILRLIESLERFDYITRLGEGRYALGPALLQMGHLYQNSFRLADYVVPALQRMMSESGETSAFFVRRGPQRVCLNLVETENVLRAHLQEGEVRNLLPSGTGKVLKAFGEDGPGRFVAERERYLAINLGERNPDIASVACPIFGTEQALMGAISVSGPITRFRNADIRRFIPIVYRTAGELTARLGGDGAPMLERAQRAYH